VGGKRLKVSASELVALPAADVRPAKSSYALGAAGGERKPAPSSEASGSLEVVLVGLRVDEAIPRVDKVLDEAAVADRREVRVVHGFGSGRLRKAVAGLLNGHPHVATFHAAEPSHGGGGVTVVELKD
jgi:DNA mismatch repair protein MutS2